MIVVEPQSRLLPLTALPQALAGSFEPVAWHGMAPLSGDVFAAAVGRLASRLAARTESTWALCADNAWHFAIGLFALWHAGKTVVLPNNFLPATLDSLAGAFDAVLDDSALVSLMRTADEDVSRLAELAPNATRLLLYTSGSTGAPKPVAKTLRQLMAEVEVLEDCWGHEMARAPVLATVPHHHIYGLLFRILWPLAARRPFELEPAFAPEQLLASAARHGRVNLVSSPAQLQRMPGWDGLPQLGPYLALCFSSGGPLPSAAADAFAAACGQTPTEIFGSTETGGIAWRRQRNDDAAWTPLPLVAFEIGAADGALSLRSPFLLDETVWHSSDAVEWLPDGRFLLKGRLDRVVKLEEKRLSLPEQEARLAEHPWVSAAALLLRPGHRTTLCAVVVPSEAGLTALAEQGKRGFDTALRSHLAAYYEPVLLPRRWRQLEALPLNERGKLCQPSLQALFEV